MGGLLVGIIITLICILIFNFIYQLYQANRCEKLQEWYERWLLDENFKKDLNEYKMEVRNLVNKAGFKDEGMPFEEPIGGGHIRTMTIVPIDQFPTRVEVIAITILRTLSAAKGVYKKRMLASVNPIKWLEFLFFLPAIILNYLGLKKESVLSKFFNLIWWFIGVVIIPILITTYAKEIGAIVKRFISYMKALV